MSESNAAVVAPTTNTPATSAETPIESAELDAADAADAADEAAEGALSTKVDDKASKLTKKDVKKAAEVEKRYKKLKLKVDGKEVEENLDLDNDEELIRHLQMSKMGQKRAQEKADLEKQVEAFFKAYQKDPFATMRELGMDPNKAIDDYINKEMENSKKSPEQIEAEKARAELQALKAEREREREESKSKELARLQEAAFQQYDTAMETALAKSSLPKTVYNVKRIADYMLVALQAGKDVTPEDVIPLVEEELNNDLQEMFASLPEDKIEKLLGNDVINKLRKRRVAKAQAAQQAVGKSNIQDTGKSDSKNSKEKSEKKMTYKDLFGI